MRGATPCRCCCSPRYPHFNPRTPCGVRHDLLVPKPCLFAFQSTHPMRGATLAGDTALCCRLHFNPRTPCGVRLKTHAIRILRWNFNPRTPCGVRLMSELLPLPGAPFQSTHPMRGATSFCRHISCTRGSFQSTHPMRGATSPYLRPSSTSSVFQSTHPMRGATPSPNVFPAATTHFNPRTPCGVRQVKKLRALDNKLFQSTHPMRGATLNIFPRAYERYLFQSTHPMRGATV